ncbi:MAG: MATE family efflux transporter [Firmicutes bacterium]|nr:MATE family efflux transporter [Bacillota bacterium]
MVTAKLSLDEEFYDAKNAGGASTDASPSPRASTPGTAPRGDDTPPHQAENSPTCADARPAPGSDAGSPAPVNPLRDAPVGKLLVKLSLPAVIAMLANAIYNIVDRAFIGNAQYLGEGGAAAAMAALQYCFPPMMITFGIALMFGIGGSVLYSIALGKRDHESAKRIMHTALGLTLAVSAVLFILTVGFTEWVMKPFLPSPGKGASAQDLASHRAVTNMAVTYFRITSCAVIFQAINVFGNNFIRANGHPITSMLAIMLAALLNVLLDFIFIFVLKLGVTGAAVATVIAQGCSTAWILYYFFGKKNGKFFKTARFRLEIKKIRIEPKLSRRIIATGFPMFVFQAASSILTIVLTFTVYRYVPTEGLDGAGVAAARDAAVASIAVINSILTLLLMPLTGINQGMNPILGYNYGAQNYGRVKKTLALGTVAASVFALLVWGATRLFPDEVIGFFTPYPELVDKIKPVLNAWLLATFLLGITVVGGNYFQGTGKAGRAMLLSLLRQVLIVVPLVLVLPLSLGYDGIFYAQPISDAAVTAVTVILLEWEFLRNPKYRGKKIVNSE